MLHRAAPLLLVLTALGCQSQPRQTFIPLEDAPLTDAAGRPRSLALDTPALDATGYTGDASGGAWFTDRTDHLPAVTAGYATPRYFVSETFTRDRQFTSDGRVRDFFYETTRRRTIIEGTR